MTRTALLIGAPTYGLRGVDNDVAAMTDALAARGFEITQCVGPAATRDGILGAYEQLIRRSRPDDAVVIFYSGHGGLIEPPAGDRGDILPAYRRFIVPVDFTQSTPDDFRGITGIELSVLLGRLTRRIPNVTVVLDCCFAGTMSRAGDLITKSLPEPKAVDLRSHLNRLLHGGLRVDLTRPLGNSFAVRVVACAPEQRSYEYGGRRGDRIGVFTEALTDALTAAGDAPVTWSTLMTQVRQNVLDVIANQRPDAEGPFRRLLFEVDEEDVVPSLPVVWEGLGRVRLDGAPLIGVEPGDQFVIMPAGTTVPDEGRSLGTVRIDGRGPAAAVGGIDPPHIAPPVGARAFRVRTVAPRVPVALPPVPELIVATAGSTFVRPAEPGERHSLRVRVDAAGMFTVADAIGPLRTPRPGSGSGSVRSVVKDLERVARATSLRKIAEQPGWESDARIVVEWGRVTEGRPSPLPTSGALVHVGDPIYLTVRNEGDDSVHVSLVDIGVSARISVLNPAQPSGRLLRPKDEYLFGRDDRDGRLTGVPLTWPTGLDDTWPRPETILAIVTSQAQDVSMLEQDSVSRAEYGPRSPLDALLRQVATGAARDIPKQPTAADRYIVHTVEFDLSPRH